jgi:DNA-directed RNA polymerase specialized sigma24 family protein
VSDEEDIALSALDSFFRGMARGRLPALDDRRGLWPLLVTITARKAGKLARRESRRKRGGGLVRGESALIPGGETGGEAAWDEFLAREPAPAFACQVADECRQLLARLSDPGLREVALWKMEGCSNAEIANMLGCVESTVERKLRLIRSVWSKDDLS